MHVHKTQRAIGCVPGINADICGVSLGTANNDKTSQDLGLSIIY